MGFIQANKPENKYSNITGYLVWQPLPSAKFVPTDAIGTTWEHGPAGTGPRLTGS